MLGGLLTAKSSAMTIESSASKQQQACDCLEAIKAAAAAVATGSALRAVEDAQQQTHQRSLDDSISKLPPLFPPSMSQLFRGATRVTRQDFVESLSLGVPVDQDVTGNEEVLILYTDLSAMPNKRVQEQSAKIIDFVTFSLCPERIGAMSDMKNHLSTTITKDSKGDMYGHYGTI